MIAAADQLAAVRRPARGRARGPPRSGGRRRHRAADARGGVRRSPRAGRAVPRRSPARPRRAPHAHEVTLRAATALIATGDAATGRATLRRAHRPGPRQRRPASSSPTPSWRSGPLKLGKRERDDVIRDAEHLIGHAPGVREPAPGAAGVLGRHHRVNRGEARRRGVPAATSRGSVGDDAGPERADPGRARPGVDAHRQRPGCDPAIARRAAGVRAIDRRPVGRGGVAAAQLAPGVGGRDRGRRRRRPRRRSPRSPRACRGPTSSGGRWRSTRRSSWRSGTVTDRGGRDRACGARSAGSSVSRWRRARRWRSSCCCCSSTGNGRPQPDSLRRAGRGRGCVAVAARRVRAGVRRGRPDRRRSVDIATRLRERAATARAGGDDVGPGRRRRHRPSPSPPRTPTLAESLWRSLEPYSGTGLALPGAGYFGAVDRCLGLLAATLGDRQRATELLASACGQEQRRGATLWEARAAADLRSIRVSVQCECRARVG